MGQVSEANPIPEVGAQNLDPLMGYQISGS